MNTIHSTRTRGFLPLTLALAACAALHHASAQTIVPPFDADYSYVDIGTPNGVPGPLGGITFKRNDPNTVLIGGAANTINAKIYSIGVTRDGDGRITGFSGTAVEIASGAASNGIGGIDGGLDYAPNGVLMFTSYTGHTIEQLKPGSTVPDKSINLGPLGIAPSVGSLYFVPPGLPGAGRLKILSYNGSSWHDATVTPDGNGTYDLATIGPAIPIPAASGPEGAISVGAGNAGFPSNATLIAAYLSGKIVAYDVNANGDPIPGTARDFMTGLSGAEGAVVDPVTNDFLFSTFGGGDRVIVVRGFLPPPPITEPLLTTIWTGAKAGGDAVPTAGTDPRIAAGSKFVKFGIPAINDDGQRAFTASWAAAGSKGTGILAGNPEALIAALGDPAPGTDGNFSGFKDPMLNQAGRVTFLGKAKGGTITPPTDTGIWSNVFTLDSALALIAREGGGAPGVTDATFKTFKSVAASDGGIGFTAFLNEGPGGVTKDNDNGLWIDAGFGPVLVAREGQTLPEGTVKKFLALQPGALTRGHGNGVGEAEFELLLGIDEELGAIVIPDDEPVVNVRVQFLDGTQALYQARATGLTLVTQSGFQAAGYAPGVTYSKFGVPGPGRDGKFAFLAKSKGPGVTGANGSSVNLFTGSNTFRLITNGEAVPDISGTTFKSFKDPVANSIGQLLIPAKIAGSGITTSNDEGIWWTNPLLGLHAVAREGGIAPGTANEDDEHGVFGKFRSIAMPEHGRPVFIAKLLSGPGGTTKANDDGAWATGPHGFPQIILREGQGYDAKTVRKFALLGAVGGSSTHTRAHNGDLRLLMRVEFTDKSQAIVLVTLPDSAPPDLTPI